MATVLANALTRVLDKTDPMTLLREGASLAASAATMKAVTYAGTLAASRALRGSPILGSDPAAPPRHRVKVAHTSFTFTSNIVKSGRLVAPVHMLAQLSHFVTKHPQDLRATVLVQRIAGTLDAINTIMNTGGDRIQSRLLRYTEQVRIMAQMLLAHFSKVTLRDTPKFYNDAKKIGVTLLQELEECVSVYTGQLIADRNRARRRKRTM